MATVGYDNSIRLWDMSTMNVINIIEDKQSKNDKDGQINALAWEKVQAKKKEEVLAIGTSAGLVKIIDTKKNKVLHRLQISEMQIFDADWNLSGIALGSEDGRV